MSLQVIKRSLLTKAVVDFLKAADVLVGRGIAPPEGGYPSGQAGSSTFVPYVVLKTGPATTPAPGQPERLRFHQTSWVVGYTLTYHHNRESSVDEYADVVRDVLIGLPETYSIDGVDWRMQRAETPRLGPTERDESTSPTHWRLTDDVSLHLSRVLAH